MLKKILKKLIIGLGVLILSGVLGFTLFKTVYTPSHLKDGNMDLSNIIVTLPEDDVKNGSEENEDDAPEKTRDELWIDHIKSSDRVNVLLMGTDGFRADTLMFMSYSKKDNDISLISVPRDTYNKVEGRNYSGQDKINAVYCFGDGDGGPENQKKAVEQVLGVPIHYYVNVNYNGLKAIVNTLGGIEVNVHRNMSYDDPYASPPLYIHLNAGRQVLTGDQAMGYVRWRKNNDGSGDSDLERTKRQQNFVIEVVKKSFGFDILNVIGLTFDYVKTDMSKTDVLYYGTELMGFDFSTVQTHMVPGEADYRYYYHDPAATKALVQEIYGFQ